MPYVQARDRNLWQLPEHALAYLAQADAIPHRAEGEAALLEFLPRHVTRVLDLGSGDGRLLALVRMVHQHLRGVALDFSDAMIARLEERFGGERSIAVVRHDLNAPLPPLDGPFDAVVSSFAIHHLQHSRKRSLYAEIYDRLEPSGVFCNLEHVASATPARHAQFLERLGIVDEDPSRKLLDVETQLSWLRDITAQGDQGRPPDPLVRAASSSNHARAAGTSKSTLGARSAQWSSSDVPLTRHSQLVHRTGSSHSHRTGATCH